MSKITPTFNSKMSQRIDKLARSIEPDNHVSVVSGEYRAVLSAIGGAMLSGTDVDVSVKNFIEDHMTYFKRHIPEMHYVLLLVLSLRGDDITKHITDQHIQDAAIEAFISLSKRYSQILSSRNRDIYLQQYQASINFLTHAVLSFTLDIKDGYPIKTIDQQERLLLLNEAKVYTRNALKYMIENNIPYLWTILDNIPVAWESAPIHNSMFEQKDIREGKVSKYQKNFNYRNSANTYSTINPDCIEVIYHRTTSYNDMLEKLNEYITTEYAVIDVHSMFMLQKHMDSLSTDKPTTHQTISCSYHVGLCIVYYYEVMGIDISEMLTEEYIKFIFKMNGNTKNDANDNFITVHNCIAYLDRKFGYDKDVIKDLNKYRNYLKLMKLI